MLALCILHGKSIWRSGLFNSNRGHSGAWFVRSNLKHRNFSLALYHLPLLRMRFERRFFWRRAKRNDLRNKLFGYRIIYTDIERIGTVRRGYKGRWASLKLCLLVMEKLKKEKTICSKSWKPSFAFVTCPLAPVCCYQGFSGKEREEKREREREGGFCDSLK